MVGCSFFAVTGRLEHFGGFWDAVLGLRLFAVAVGAGGLRVVFLSGGWGRGVFLGRRFFCVCLCGFGSRCLADCGFAVRVFAGCWLRLVFVCFTAQEASIMGWLRGAACLLSGDASRSRLLSLRQLVAFLICLRFWWLSALFVHAAASVFCHVACAVLVCTGIGCSCMLSTRCWTWVLAWLCCIVAATASMSGSTLGCGMVWRLEHVVCVSGAMACAFPIALRHDDKRSTPRDASSHAVTARLRLRIRFVARSYALANIYPSAVDVWLK